MYCTTGEGGAMQKVLPPRIGWLRWQVYGLLEDQAGCWKISARCLRRLRTRWRIDDVYVRETSCSMVTQIEFHMTEQCQKVQW